LFKRLRNRLTYANVMATAAVFIALGGTSVAAIALKRGSVKGKHIARNAVTSPKVKRNSLTGADVNEARLAQVPSAANAARLDGSSLGEVRSGIDAAALGGLAASAFMKGSGAGYKGTDTFDTTGPTTFRTLLTVPGVMRVEGVWATPPPTCHVRVRREGNSTIHYTGLFWIENPGGTPELHGGDVTVATDGGLVVPSSANEVEEASFGVGQLRDQAGAVVTVLTSAKWTGSDCVTVAQALSG
jgi:hypothetical protein